MTDSEEISDHLTDILDGAEKAIHFVQGMSFGEFSLDDRTQFAVVKAIEIVGEATKRLPMSLRASHPDVPWREMAGMGDKLVHDYTNINLMVVWRTVHEDLPEIVRMVDRISTADNES